MLTENTDLLTCSVDRRSEIGKVMSELVAVKGREGVDVFEEKVVKKVQAYSSI